MRHALAVLSPASPLAWSLALLPALILTAGRPSPAAAQQPSPPPLLPEPVVRAIAGEVSGSAAKRTVQDLALSHRMRGSRGFRAAAEWVRDRARESGLAVEIISLPADGKVFYGTQRSRPAWDADFAELWEMRQDAGRWAEARRVASWETRPITLAQDSASGEVESDLVDVGEGTTAADYAGKDVRGKLVLAGAQPGPVSELAVDRFGAAGIVSWAQNQPTAWSRDDDNQVRWGHLQSFPPPKTFAFMVSLRQARAWQERIEAGERVRLHARVRAGQHPGSYDIVTATLPGRDPALRGEEIVFSCHLDHPRPGANDNASGCAAILEVARTLAKLVTEKRIPAPRRTIRWILPPEIEGTIALLNARPAMASRARAVIHMDMVGGDAEATQAVFHVTRSPKSLPTFVNDVAEAFGRWVNEQSYAFAATGEAPYPLIDPEGSKRALQAEMTDFTEGSDHQVWTEGSFRVPAIYMNDWPDRTIHTHADGVQNIDPTKLLRAAFLGAASGYYLADLDAAGVPALWEAMRAHALERAGSALARAERARAAGGDKSGGQEAANVLRFQAGYERGALESIAPFAAMPAATRQQAEEFLAGLGQLAGGGAVQATAGGAGQSTVFRRDGGVKGPMEGFGYSYQEDRRKQAGIPDPALLEHEGLWGGGAEYAYEALNLVDGKRTVQQVRDSLSAIYGPVPVAMVQEYLEALEKIGVLRR
jgi:aminopeptidase YwaD